MPVRHSFTSVNTAICMERPEASALAGADGRYLRTSAADKIRSRIRFEENREIIFIFGKAPEHSGIQTARRPLQRETTGTPGTPSGAR